MKKVVFPEVK